jgi:hypothetical protein
MGFGDFMSGMQGGMGAMDDLKNSRLRRKLYDQALTEGDYMLTGKERARERAGLPGIERSRTSDTLIGKLGDKLDPVLSRFMESLGRGSGATESPTAMELPTAEEMAPEEAPSSEYYDEAIPLADGRRPMDDPMRRAEELSLEEDSGPKQRQRYNADSPDEISKRAGRARAASPPPSEAIPTQVVDRSGDKTLGQRAKAYATRYDGVGGPSMTAKEGAGAFRRGARKVVGGLGRGAIIGTIAAGASGGIRGAVQADQPGDSILGDTWERAKGAGKGVVTGILDPLGEPGRWRGEGEAPPPEAAPPEAVPTTSGQPNPRRYPGQGAARRAAPAPADPSQAIPEAAPAEVNPLDGFDVTKVSAADIPNFSNQDWVSFREEAIKDYVSSGMSYAEAWDKVDQQVVATQQRGFMHFGNQARALLASGDLNGAATAVRAAFQYFPSTTDLEVGEYNGHLVAFGVDEDTGEQVGTPMVVTPEFLDSALMNFSDRKAWTEFAQDNRKMDQADTELGQGDRRLDLMEEGLGIDRENALTRRIDAIGGGLAGGGSSLKESDVATARRQLGEWADSFMDDEGADPALPAALRALAEAQYQRSGGDLESITFRLEEMLRSPGGAEMIIAAARRLVSGK